MALNNTASLATAGATIGGPVGGLIGGGVGLISDLMGSGAEAAQNNRQWEADKRAAEEEKRRYKARKEAYRNIIAKGGRDQQAGEGQFLTETGQPLAELGQARNSVLTGQAQALNQAQSALGSSLNKGGVRGGQAATQLRRNAGQMGIDTNRYLDEMSVDEASRRRDLRSSFFGNKSAAGQGATYTPVSF